MNRSSSQKDVDAQRSTGAIQMRVIAFVTAAVCVAVMSGCGGTSAPKVNSRSRPTPRVVSVVAHRLVARNALTQRSALAPALAAVLPRGRLLPRGSGLKLDPRGWRASGRFANATGTLRVPRRKVRRVEVGFVRTHQGWRVTFLEPLP